MNRRYGLASLEAVALLLLLGFNQSAVWPQQPATAQNLPSTANWVTIKRGSHLTIRVNPEADLSANGAISVGDVAYTGPSRKLNPQDSAKLVSLLRDSLARDLSAAGPAPQAALTHPLTLNASITSVKSSHPLINLVTIAAVFVPLDLGGANVTAWLVDPKTGRAMVEIEAVGCGQIYQVLGSLQALGQGKIALKKESRSIAREVTRMISTGRPPNAAVATLAVTP